MFFSEGELLLCSLLKRGGVLPRSPPSSYSLWNFNLHTSLCVIFPPQQDTESTSAQPPAPPGPEGPGPSAEAIDTEASVEAGSDPTEALLAGMGEEQGGGGASSGLGSEQEEEEEAEVVEELPLPELYVPGRIVHIYRQGAGR